MLVRSNRVVTFCWLEHFDNRFGKGNTGDVTWTVPSPQTDSNSAMWQFAAQEFLR